MRDWECDSLFISGNFNNAASSLTGNRLFIKCGRWNSDQQENAHTIFQMTMHHQEWPPKSLAPGCSSAKVKGPGGGRDRLSREYLIREFILFKKDSEGCHFSGHTCSSTSLQGDTIIVIKIYYFLTFQKRTGQNFLASQKQPRKMLGQKI